MQIVKLTLMKVEALFARFRRTQTENQKELPQEPEQICQDAIKWAEKVTGGYKLNDEPFGLTLHEVKAVQTGAAEIKTEELIFLAKNSGLNEVELIRQVREVLDNQFASILRSFEWEFEFNIRKLDADEMNVVKAHLEVCRLRVGREFPWEEKRANKLESICDSIKQSRPAIFLLP